ncbi:MAG: DUF5302 domain-containing protein [Pseudolysinimonas sp.]
MAEQESEKSTTDDAKAKFREALERKKQNQQQRPGYLDAGSAVHSAHGKAGGKREFRRKSG